MARPEAVIRGGKDWTLIHGDSCVDLADRPDESIDFSVYSPPFISLFTYTNSERDIGNCTTRAEFFEHLGYVTREVFRLTKPGRLSAVHIAQVTSTQATHGVIGLIDLRGMLIQHQIDNGWIYHGDITIDKDPQAQAIRTHSKALLFVQKNKDSSWLRPALADYIAVFRKPGENQVPIKCDLTNEEWIEWARPIWYGIRESDTLNAVEARGSDDERHVCPLQLGTIERCIRLWSNPGENVLSPFAGIGSEGYEAVRLGRKFVGCELKQEYADCAVKNLHAAERMKLQGKSQRSKGRRGELEALALLAEYGIDGELRYGQEERGGGLGDIDSTVGNFEVKRRASLPAWMRLTPEVRGVLVRQDRGEWMVLLRAKDALGRIRDDV